MLIKILIGGLLLLMLYSLFQAMRVMMQGDPGFADTRPQAINTTVDGRARNRRVEIVVKQPLDEQSGAILREIR